MDILSLLYEDCTSFCERLRYNYSSEYKVARDNSLKLEEKLYTYFTEEVKTLYEEVRMAQLEKESIEDARRFRKAFSFGAMLMLEILQEDL